MKSGFHTLALTLLFFAMMAVLIAGYYLAGAHPD
jgi:hypothetical protein